MATTAAINPAHRQPLGPRRRFRGANKAANSGPCSHSSAAVSRLPGAIGVGGMGAIGVGGIGAC